MPGRPGLDQGHPGGQAKAVDVAAGVQVVQAVEDEAEPPEKVEAEARPPDVAVVGGSEACITYGSWLGWLALKAMADDTCRPFSLNRKGMVLGEGGAALVLEEYEHARARGANILAELAGYGATSDAHHITSPHGRGAEAAIREMREEAGLTGLVIEALGTISYKFWAQSEKGRVSKSVEFFLMLYRAGSPAKFSPGEVENVKLLPIEEAEALITHDGEKAIMRAARRRVRDLSADGWMVIEDRPARARIAAVA